MHTAIHIAAAVILILGTLGAVINASKAKDTGVQIANLIIAALEALVSVGLLVTL